MIGTNGKRKSRESVLAAQYHDGVDDDGQKRNREVFTIGGK